jgi:tetratricopeptide (TPR) repeat protein
MNARSFLLVVACGALLIVEAAGARNLHGRILNGGSTPSQPVGSAGVRMSAPREQTKNETTTDSHGEFSFHLPDSLRGGDQVRLEVRATRGDKNLLLFQPLDGQVRIPADPDTDLITIEVLPEGSLRFQSDDGIRAVLALANSEGEKKGMQLSRIGPVAEFDLENFIQEWAKGHGLEPVELVARVKDWADKVRTNAAASLEEKALAAFAHRDFAQAGGLFADAANAHKRELAALQKNILEMRQKQGQEHLQEIQDYEQSAAADAKAGLYERTLKDCRDALSEIDPRGDGYAWQLIKTMEGNAHQMLAASHVGSASDEHFEAAIQDYQDVERAFPGPEHALERSTAEIMWAVTLYQEAGTKNGLEAEKLKREAIEREEQNLAVYTREAYPQIWATGQLAMAYMNADLAGGVDRNGAAQFLQRAQQAVDHAKEVNSRDRAPLQWALTELFAGEVLFMRAHLSDAETARTLMRQAEDAFESAQQELPPAGVLIQTLNEELLSEVWLAESSLSDGARRMELFNKVLEVRKKIAASFSPDREPRLWAGSHVGLGQARGSLAQISPPAQRKELLHQAELDDANALRVFTRDASPTEWAEAQLDMARSLQGQAERSPPEEMAQLLAKAEDAAQKALEVRKREESPADWAETKRILAVILMDEAGHGDTPQRKDQINRALQAVRDAMGVFTRDSALPLWAELQISMGRVLETQSALSDTAEALKLLDDAEAAFQDVLRSIKREVMPDLWARTQLGYGQALMNHSALGRTQDPAQLKTAEEAERAALEILRPDRDSDMWVEGEQVLAGALIAEASGDKSDQAQTYLRQAIDSYQSVLRVWTREQSPDLWAQTKGNLGNTASALAYISEPEQATGLLEQAIHAYEDAQTFYTHDRAQETWARLQMSLAGTKLDLADRSNPDLRVKLATEAVGLYEILLGILTPQSNPDQWGWAEMELGHARVDQAEAGDPAAARPLLEKATEAERKMLQFVRKDQFPQVWGKGQMNLGQALENEAQLDGTDGSQSLSRQAADAFSAVLEVDPRNSEARSRLSGVLQDDLFDYEKAFVVNDAYTSLVPGDYAAGLDFVEIHFTTGRFQGCLERSAKMRAEADLSPSGRLVLGVLEIMCNLGLHNRPEAKAKFAEIDTLLASADSAKALPSWSFKGTTHFINTSDAFVEYKEPLTQLLHALESGDIEAIRRNLKPVGASLAGARAPATPGE